MKNSLFYALILFVLSGISLYSVFVFDGKTGLLDDFLEKKASFEGYVSSDPERKDSSQRFYFSVDGEKILVTVSRFPERLYGDKLVLTGKIEKPENFIAYENGPEFDYVSYLAKDGVHYVLYMPKVEILGTDSGNSFVKKLFAIKRVLVQKMEELLPEPHSSLLGGILLGDKSSLPKETVDDWKRAGLVHILVLSGYNVTIVGVALMKALSFFPRKLSQSLGALSLVLFAVMTGWGATTVRSTIMGVIGIVAESTARRYDVLRALSFSAVIMAFLNPMVILFDVSFELSFLSTLALILVSPLVSQRITFITEKYGIREIVSATIATQIFTAPFLFHVMGQISIVSLFTNLLVLPTVPIVMFLGFVAIVSGFIFMPLAFLFVWSAEVLLSYMLFVASFFGKLPFASVFFTINAPITVGAYLCYGFLIYHLYRKPISLKRGNGLLQSAS